MSWRLQEEAGVQKQELRPRLLRYIDVNFNSKRDLEFISVLRVCLNHAGCIEAAAGNRPVRGRQASPERIQAYNFENIVKPLHKCLVNPKLPRSTWPAMPSYDQAVLDGSNHPKLGVYLYDSFIGNGTHEEKGLYEKKFWKDMEIFTEKYISPLALSDDVRRIRPWPREKVRIAVIDSGVRKEDAETAAAEVTQRIRGYRNFTSSDLNDCEDQVGHGTMIARLLLTVAPQAEVYIAKVTDKKIMPKNQLYRIAEAIKWAVDIISISLALSEEHYDVNEEITEAPSPSSQDAERKLVFAAAGNRGPCAVRAFPARKEGVIAVDASDGSGEWVKLNPNSKSKLNLSTLGENIKIRCPDSANPGKMKDVYISGSSFATPIAAGIAANVLEFARYRLKLNGWKKDEV
ncbi:peptidase S8/S53 domain-containing protein [Trichoderma compactum]